jgi:hypothetical protein
MSHGRHPICQMSGKIRYREPKDVKFALRQADRERCRARLDDVSCNRRETHGYICSDCDGWHLTSQPNLPTLPSRLASVAHLPVHVPGPAAEAIRRMANATGLTAGFAA